MTKYNAFSKKVNIESIYSCYSNAVAWSTPGNDLVSKLEGGELE